MERLTYGELVRVGWRLFWRTVGAFMLVTYAVTSFLLFAMPDITRSGPSLWVTFLPVAVGVAISVFAIMPLIVRQALRKPFRGFHLQAVRR
jgi:hypothetical protein